MNKNKDVQKTYRLEYLVMRNTPLRKSLLSKEYCPCCGEFIKNHESKMMAHLKSKHFDYILDLFEKEENKKPAEERGVACPVCGDINTCMKTHAKRVHNMDWQTFKDSTGYQGGTHYVSPSHKEKVSEKKRAYYQRPEGLAYKKVQGERVKGSKNPACRPEVRNKISRSRLGQKVPRKTREVNSSKGVDRLLRDNQLLTRGYFFKLLYNNQYFYARSFTEFKVLASLLYNNIDFKQESMKVEYYDEGEGITRYYLPDFVIGSTVYETKVKEEELKNSKYRGVKKACDKIGFEFKLLNNSNFKENLNIYPLSKLQLQEFILYHINDHTLHIVPPNCHHGSRKFLIDLLGENFEDILKDNEEKFNENKKNSKI